MPDDKSKRGAQDHARVAAEEPYEVAYFARKHGLTPEQAKRIIDQAGNSRARADELAEKSKDPITMRRVITQPGRVSLDY